MSLRTLYARRVRGVRLVDLWGFAFAVILALGVYLSKTGAGGDGAQISTLQRGIAAEHQRIRLLRAEVAFLEQPERISHLSETQLGLTPPSGKREAELTELGEIARGAHLQVTSP